MGKKIIDNTLHPTPQKLCPTMKLDRDNINIQNPQSLLNGIDNFNMMPHSNGHKKLSLINGGTGSGKTEDNPKVEEERNQTFISGFNLSEEHENNQKISPDMMDLKLDEADNPDSDNHSKLIKKDNQYIKFFKFYYDKLRTQHPQWTPVQITMIVSLQWKKKKMIDRMPAKTQSINPSTRRSNKPLSAKDAFKMKHKDMTREQIDQIWSKLPQQSRNFWKKQGQSYGNGSKLSDIDSVKNSKAQKPVFNKMRFLFNQL